MRYFHIKSIIAFASLMMAAFTPLAASGANFSVTPGSVAELIATSLKAGDTTLKLKGNIDASDLFALRGLPEEVTELDLSAVNVVAYSSPVLVEGRMTYPASSIPDFALFGSKVNKLILPAGVKTIGEGALAGAAITELTLPASLVELGDYALYDCASLAEVSLPSSLKSLGRSPFGRCGSLTSVDLSATLVTTIPDECFAGCTSLKDVRFPANVSNIGRESFRDSGIEILDISTISSTSPFALSGMPMLKEVTLRRNADYAPGLLMDDKKLTTAIEYPIDLPTLFVAGCTALDKRKIMEDAESIGSFAIAGMSAVNIDLGAGLKYVDRNAFSAIGSLVSIDASALDNNIPDVAPDAFEAINPSKIQLYVTPASVDVWKAHPEWGKMDVISNTNDITEVNRINPLEVKFSYADGRLVVKSNRIITAIAVYALDGSLLGAVSPAAEEAMLSIDAEKGTPVAIRVDASKNTKIFKTIL